MFLFDNLYVELLVYALSACWFGFWAAVIISRQGMKKNEKSLKKMNVIPSGSMISHGMVIDESRGVGVIRYAEPSENWFKRLL